MSRFDPKSGEPYARCRDCSVVAENQADARQHMNETHGSKGNSSHSMSITNPTRPERIESGVRLKVDHAISEAMDDLDRLVARGETTDDEIKEALRWYPDFADAWDEFVKEGDRG